MARKSLTRNKRQGRFFDTLEFLSNIGDVIELLGIPFRLLFKLLKVVGHIFPD